MLPYSLCLHCDCDPWFIVSPVTSIVMEFGNREILRVGVGTKIYVRHGGFSRSGAHNLLKLICSWIKVSASSKEDSIKECATWIKLPGDCMMVFITKKTSFD